MVLTRMGTPATSEAKANQLGLKDRIIFVGAQKNPLICYRLFDVFALPSLWEGTPLVLIEAMMAGVPVVATAVDGVKETLVHEETALLVPPGDSKALGYAILTMLDCDHFWPDMTDKARDVALSTFDAPIVVEQYEALYQRLVRGTLNERVDG